MQLRGSPLDRLLASWDFSGIYLRKSVAAGGQTALGA